MTPLFASITDPIVNLAVDFIDAVGLIGVFILMTLESACVPVPSEATKTISDPPTTQGSVSRSSSSYGGLIPLSKRSQKASQ
jgi:hypothetical protein